MEQGNCQSHRCTAVPSLSSPLHPCLLPSLPCARTPPEIHRVAVGFVVQE